jgi:Contractile injection system tube protein
MALTGEFEKMTVYAYNNADLSDSHKKGEYKATINPENYVLDIKMEFNDGQGTGTSGAQPRFKLKNPEELSFEFLFDNTGIIDNNPKENITDDINSFKELLMGFDGDTHEPKFFKLVWGDLLFKARCTGLNIAYKLFNPDGTPIRAVCKGTFKELKEEELRVSEENRSSPDLTHFRVVQKGDTLPLMCYQIYGDAKYYLQVAQVNKLANFRNLQPGAELFFPPFEKTTA